MANELTHKTVGASMTQAEYEAIDSHVFSSQATGDILYASSASQLSRLGIGASDGLFLVIAGGIPSWGGGDDSAIKFGTGGTASLLYETADADANALLLALPAGGGVDVPVFAIGDVGGVSVLNADLGFFNGQTQPMLAVIDNDNDSWIGLTFDADDIAAIKSNRSIRIMPSGDTDDYLTIATVSNIPTIYGTGAYVRIGDAATASYVSGEDDLLVTGSFEINGILWAQGTSFRFINGTDLFLLTTTNGHYFWFAARNVDGAVWDEVARVVNANDPYWSFGSSQQHKFQSDGKIGFNAATPVAQQAHIVDADGTLADITAKFNTLLTYLETGTGFGFLAAA